MLVAAVIDGSLLTLIINNDNELVNDTDEVMIMMAFGVDDVANYDYVCALANGFAWYDADQRHHMRPCPTD